MTPEKSINPSSDDFSLPDKWVDEHGDYLFNYAVYRVRKPALAEDLVQDTFLAAIKSQANFAGNSSLRSWLVGILKNKIVDYYRKLGRETSFTDLEFYQENEEKHFDIIDHWCKETAPVKWKPEAQSKLDSAEFQQTLQECLSKLPPRIADVFILREVEEVESEAICEMLSLTKNNFWTMLHRARMALRDCLEINWFGDKKKTG